MEETLQQIKSAVERGEYALRPHAVSHMLVEGFCEASIVEAIQTGTVLEAYIDEDRCLLVGRYTTGGSTQEFLHVVVDYWSESGVVDWIDIVTAYIPRRPIWEGPRQRRRRK